MTDQPTPETDAFCPCRLTPSDWPEYARALEIQRNAARTDVAHLRAELATERAKKSDALIAAVQDIERLTAERDALRDSNRKLKELLLLLARAVHDENWREIGNLMPHITEFFATPAQRHAN